MRKIICLLSVILLFLGVSTTASCASKARQIEKNIALSLIDKMYSHENPASIKIGYVTTVTEDCNVAAIIMYSNDSKGELKTDFLGIVLNDFVFDQQKYNYLYEQYINDGRVHKVYGRTFEDSKSYIDYYYNAVVNPKYDEIWEDTTFSAGSFFFIDDYMADKNIGSFLMRETALRSNASKIKVSEYNINKILHDYKKQMGWLL